MVEMIGRNALDAASRHRHRRISLETCHTQEGDQRAGNILAYATTVGVVHLRVVKRKALPLAHADTGVADIVGHPMGQHGDLFHLRLFTFYEFVHLLLRFGQGVETAVCLVQVMKPERFIFPSRRGRHHQLRSFIKKIDHVRFTPEREHLVLGKGIHLASVFVTHRRGAGPVIELELEFLLHRHTDGVHFAPRRLVHPEGDDVIELSPHGRDESRVIVLSPGQQGISESFFTDFVRDGIARFQASEFDHNLAGSPVDGPCGSGIIAGFRYVHLHCFAIGTLQGDLLETGKRRQRIVIILDHMIVYCPFGGLHSKGPVHGETT